MTCVRCSRNEDVEEHHIIERSHGGSDELENKEYLCLACHDYEHAKRNILASLEKAKIQKQFKRVAVYEHRLKVLEELNTPGLIRERKQYQTWWVDESTRDMPRYEKVAKLEKRQLQYEMNLSIER